jgi:hypothetical protein
MRIRDLLRRDLDRKIEEVIQLDQAEPHAVYDETTEYVATGRIKNQYRDLLQAINSARTEPTEGIGVWISGFFGSGKSSFAKNLGYVLSDNDAAPFGGMKMSGSGRELGSEGVSAFTETKHVHIDFAQQPQMEWWFPYERPDLQDRPKLQDRPNL